MTDIVSSVMQQVQRNVQQNDARQPSNLAWLQTAMHPYFFSFNRDQTDALAVLVEGINRIERLPFMRLIDNPERLMLAQLAATNSIYNTLKVLKPRDNLSYSEINTSLKPLPERAQALEVMRFDYDLKSDAEIAAAMADQQAAPVPAYIVEQVAAAAAQAYPLDYQQVEFEKLLRLLWVNNPQYVQVSHAERLARVMYLYHQTQQSGGIYLDMQALSQREGTETARIMFGVSNPPQHDFLLQVFEVFKRLNIGVKRAYTVTMSNGVFPTFLATFYVNPRDGVLLEKGNTRYRELQNELYNTQIMSSSSASFRALVETGLMSAMDANLIKALITFCYTNLAHNQPDRYDPDEVQRAFHHHPDISQRFVNLFYARFDPELSADERTQRYTRELSELTQEVDNFNTGRRLLDETRRTIFRCAMSFINHCLKTNFFVPEKHALAFRLNPVYLDELDVSFTADLPKDRPFRITFFSGRSGSGYHIGFSDIARGGWRTLMTQGHDDFVNSANTLFRENYVLAHTQHLKNKDIYEGGSKMVTILNTRPGTPKNTVLQYLYKLQYGFTQAFLDLFVTDTNGNAKDPRVVDYYGEQEPIELGPDENMHDVMIEIIAQQAVKRGYILGSGIMSSKQVGINHKEYGVTSRGVMRFAEVTMQETQGINMHTDAFSVKITGGPNGDVAGNSMKLLLERCPNVQIRMIVDGTGAVFDPAGVEHAALAKIVLKDDLQALDVNALHVGGFMIYRLQKHKDGIRELYRKVHMTEQGLQESWISTDEFYKTFDSLPFTVQTDLFIPAGGRPETIAAYNVANFSDKQGKPSAKVVIEGANSFITPDARLVLQQQGVVIMRDASANKCGVISSSYEILGNLMLSDAEFLAHKAAYVADVLQILNRLAEQEARLIIKRHREAGGVVPYTDFTNVISRQINEHYARMFAYFQANPQKVQEAAYRHAILQNMAQLIQTDFPERIDRLPEKIKYAVLAVKLASSLVYENDDNTMYGDLIEAQVRRLALTNVA